MLFRNFTPFPPLQFTSRDVSRRDFGVVVLRGTFQIEHDHELRLTPEQEPILMVDDYFGEPGRSSIRFENNLAPYKPRTDIHLVANAVAPGGIPMKQWECGVDVGNLRKEFLVTGEREWRSGFGGRWTLTDPLPVDVVPIRYELAYGGAFCHGHESKVFQENPIGVGYADSNLLRTDKPIRVPQILPLETENPEIGKILPVIGLGPLPPQCPSRGSKAGTFNLVWEKTRWPDLPEDFTFDFYNSANHGLVYDGFVAGNETIRLTNLSPMTPLCFRLPGFDLAALLRFEDGQIAPAPVNLDSIHIDVPKERAYLVWRGIFPMAKPIRVLEVRMKAPDHVIEK